MPWVSRDGNVYSDAYMAHPVYGPEAMAAGATFRTDVPSVVPYAPADVAAPSLVEQFFLDYPQVSPGALAPEPAFTTPPSLARLTMEAGQDLRDITAGADVGNLAVGGPIVGVGVIALSRLLALIPATARAAVVSAFRAVGSVGTRVGWNRLPPWVQGLLIAAGATVGADIIFDTGADDRGIIQIPGTSDFGVGGVAGPGVNVVGSWTANGVRFYRLSDGRLAVQNKRGRWKVWRPKKPIVIYASGARDLNTMLRADAALNRQAKRVAGVLNRRAKPRARAPKRSGSDVIGTDGTKIVRLG